MSGEENQVFFCPRDWKNSSKVKADRSRNRFEGKLLVFFLKLREELALKLKKC